MRAVLVREEADSVLEALMVPIPQVSIDAAFNSMGNRQLAEYEDYWGGIAPKTDKEYFQRWLFAFCSVHTGWKSNVRGYQAIQGYHPDTWTGDDLRSALVSSGVGMHNNRADYITVFAEDFWNEPYVFKPHAGEPIDYLRNRLVPRIKGLGYAKTSFALEMCYPINGDVVCLDVHMLRLLGQDQKKVNHQTYKALEQYWITESSKKGVAPYISRMVYWDKLQNKDSSRYWSYVLERGDDLEKSDAGNDGQVDNSISGAVSAPLNASGYAPHPLSGGCVQAQEVST